MKIKIEIQLGESIRTYQDVIDALVCTAGSLSSAEEELELGQNAFIFNSDAEDVGVFAVMA